MNVRRIASCISGIIFPLLSSWLVAQNLVPNSSFESAMWAQANSGSADWLTASNVFGTQTPHSCIRYAGEAFGNQGGSNFREYVKCTLTAPLTIGSAYYLEMWVSLSDNYGTYACNRHGMALTTTDPYYNFSTGPIPLVPQVQSLTPLTSQTTWMLVSGTVTASAAFRYLTIGNFYNDLNTTYQFVGGNGFTYGYYFMDDIVVQPAVILGACCTRFDVVPQHNSMVKLNWTVDLATEGKIFEVQRSMDGENFEQVAAIRLEPQNLENGFEFVDETAPYNEDLHSRILQNDANGNIRYSEVKTVRLDNQGHGQLNAIYPTLVPADQGFQIEFLRRSAAGLLNVQIVDAMGRLVYSRDHETAGGLNNFWVIPEGLQSGTYIVTVTGDGTRESGKIQVMQ
jgi:hypothetical protein